MDVTTIRRFTRIALTGGLSVTAAAAVVAVATGDLSDTDTRIVLTSLGFAACSAVGSAGARARLRSSALLQAFGVATVGLSIVAFVLLVIGLWLVDWESEPVWRAFGCAAVAGLACGHACVTLGARRPTDSDSIRALTVAAVLLAAFDASGAILPLSSLVNDVGETWARVFGSAVVLLVLCSVLPPVLRLTQARAALAPRATEVIRIADRIDFLNSDPGNRAPEIRAEVKRLRNLAQSFEN